MQFKQYSGNSSNVLSQIFPEIMRDTIYNGIVLLTFLGIGFIVTISRLGKMSCSSP